MKLTHVGISNFRSIGEDFVTIDLTKKINVLVGANNCGKSNVLRALSSFGQRTDNELDRHERARETYPHWALQGLADENDHSLLLKSGKLCVRWRQTLNGDTITANPFSGSSQDDLHAFYKKYLYEFNFLTPDPNDFSEEIASGAEQEAATWLWRALKNLIPPIVFVPQFRQIKTGEDYSIDGVGIISTLARWQQAKIGEDANLVRFQKIQLFLRAILELPDLSIGVSHDKSAIVVERIKIRLPLDSYGTGLHELIIFAVAVLSHENSIVCIEEPEIHLHPLLQRRFLDFLRKETTNHYVITTHSPALIAPNADTAVIHLWLENSVTKSRPIETTEHSLGALRDLGARASDILQANSVIWVEGPSDRIYLNRWLELLYPGEFREGIDYSIMFYGGRLLSQVSLAREDAEPEDDTDDLVQLLRINQHSAILIDSDRRKSTDPINATKQRVQAQCAASNVLCWITDGREIENYLPDAVLNAVYGERFGCTPEIKLRPFGSIEDALKKALKKSWPRSSYYDQAKPKMARLISARTTNDHLTPKIIGWMEKLVRVIRHTPS